MRGSHCFLVILGVAFYITAAVSVSYYVDPNGSTFTSCGSVSNPCIGVDYLWVAKSLGAGSSVADIDIYIAAGEYTMASKYTVSIYGLNFQDVRFHGAGKDQTFLQCNPQDIVDFGLNYRLFHVTENTRVSFEDMTMRDCHTRAWGAAIEADCASNCGGPLPRVGSTLSVNNVRFANLTVGFSGDTLTGGAIDFAFRELSITNSEFIGCQAAEGGAISIYGRRAFNKTVIIEDTLFHNNKGDPNSDASKGGAVAYIGAQAAYNNSLYLRRTTFSGNEAMLGGAIHMDAGLLVMTDVNMNGGKATRGAGLYVKNTRVTAVGIVVDSQEASMTGGAVHAEDVTQPFYLADFNVSNVKADAGGGGLYLDSVTNGVMDNIYINTAEVTSGDGAGIAVVESSIVELTSAWITKGKSTRGGGLSVESGAQITIFDATFYDNEADFGGALHASSTSTIQLKNSTVEYNLAQTEGGGLYVTDTAHIRTTHTTISRNGAYNGGGVYSNALNSKITLGTGTIITNNQAYDGGGLYLEGQIILGKNVRVTNNLAQAGGSDTCKGSLGYGGGFYFVNWFSHECADYDYAGSFGDASVVIQDNEALTAGGAYYYKSNEDTSPTDNAACLVDFCRNCTITTNIATYGAVSASGFVDNVQVTSTPDGNSLALTAGDAFTIEGLLLDQIGNALDGDHFSVDISVAIAQPEGTSNCYDIQGSTLTSGVQGLFEFNLQFYALMDCSQVFSYNTTVSQHTLVFYSASYQNTYFLPLAISDCPETYILAPDTTIDGVEYFSCQLSENLSDSQQQVAVGFIIVALITYFLLAVFIVLQRKQRIMFASSPKFLMMMVIGAILEAIGVWLQIVDQTNFICNGKWWFIEYGLVFVVCGIFVRVWRLDKIFNATSLKHHVYTDWHLLKLTMIPLSYVTVITLIWTVIQPRELKSDYEKWCDGNSTVVYVVFIALWRMSAAIYGGYLTYRVRKIPSAYNEFSWLAGVMYVGIFSILIWVILAVIDITHADQRLYQSLLHLVTVYLFVVLTMFPKMVAVCMKMKTELRVKSAFRSSGRERGPSQFRGFSSNDCQAEHQKLLDELDRKERDMRRLGQQLEKTEQATYELRTNLGLLEIEMQFQEKYRDTSQVRSEQQRASERKEKKFVELDSLENIGPRPKKKQQTTTSTKPQNKENKGTKLTDL